MMNAKNHFILFVLSMLAALVYSTAVAQNLTKSVKFDPYLPGELNEQSLSSLADDDIDSARIFIERAYRLNPLSPDINANLALIRKIYNDQNRYQISRGKYTSNLEELRAKEKLDNALPSLWPKK